MKNICEKYTKEEIQLVNEIQNVLYISRETWQSTNFLPFQVRSNGAFSYCGFNTDINGKEVSVYMYLYTAKLDFAIQVWELAQELTIKRYFDYLNYEWTNDVIKTVKFTSKNRKSAEIYFEEMLKQLCDGFDIRVSERAVFKREKINDNSLILDVCIDEFKISDEIKDKIRNQFNEKKTYSSFDKQNLHFSYDEIKDFFVKTDEHLLSLLNANEGVKQITKEEKLFFEAAERLDIAEMIVAISKGVNINSIDEDGETAITKIIKAFRYDFTIVSDLEKIEEQGYKIPDYTNGEKICIIQSLLDLGADINLFGHDGLNGLQYTAYQHNDILMQFLLENGANPNVNYFDDEPHLVSAPLDTVSFEFHCCEDKEDEEKVERCYQLLLKYGAVFELDNQIEE